MLHSFKNQAFLKEVIYKRNISVVVIIHTYIHVYVYKTSIRIMSLLLRTFHIQTDLTLIINYIKHQYFPILQMRKLKYKRLTSSTKIQTRTFLALDSMCNESPQPFTVLCFFSIENIDANYCGKMLYMNDFTQSSQQLHKVGIVISKYLQMRKQKLKE